MKSYVVSFLLFKIENKRAGIHKNSFATYRHQRGAKNELDRNIDKIRVKIIRYTGHKFDYEYFVFYAYYKRKLHYYGQRKNARAKVMSQNYRIR